MMIEVPPHVDRLMRERAQAHPGGRREIQAYYRQLIEAWTEGVAYAWTMQDIEATKIR